MKSCIRGGSRWELRVSTETIHRCDFCGKTQNDVLCLVAGDHVDICNECVDLARDVVIQYEYQKILEQQEQAHNDQVCEGCDGTGGPSLNCAGCHGTGIAGYGHD